MSEPATRNAYPHLSRATGLMEMRFPRSNIIERLQDVVVPKGTNVVHARLEFGELIVSVDVGLADYLTPVVWHCVLAGDGGEVPECVGVGGWNNTVTAGGFTFYWKDAAS